MNILLALFAALAIFRGWRGMKRGLVEEIGLLLSLLLSLFVLSLAILLYTSIQEKDTKNIVLSVFVILIVGIAARLLGLLRKTLSAIAHLPVLNLLNSLMGLAVGIAEAVVALWILYIVVGNFDTGAFGERILAWTEGNVWLQKLYDMNQIASWLTTGL